MRHQAASGCPCQCQQVSNLLPAPSQEMGWAAPGKEEKQRPMAKAWPPGTTCPCPRAQTATSVKSQKKTQQAHPNPPHPSRETGFTIDLTVIPDLASKGPAPCRSPGTLKCQPPTFFYSWPLLPMFRSPRLWNKKHWAPQRPLWRGLFPLVLLMWYSRSQG